MTKVITRYFDSASKARAAEQSLLGQRLSRDIVAFYDDASNLAADLTAAHVDAAAAEAYGAKMGQGGGAVLLVKADYKPLGVAKIARDTMAAHGGAAMAGVTEEVSVRGLDPAIASSSIMRDHPRFMTMPRHPHNNNHYMANWPIPLINRRKPSDNFAFPRHARMADFPLPLTVRLEPNDNFAIPRHGRMANLFLPLTIRRKPPNRSIFGRHARMADWPIPLLDRRAPFTGSWIGKHTRMANWPFPHLINGKMGQNALMPGGPRMANYPIDLLSKRKPFDDFAFPRHARMANKILPLLSKRKPFTGSIVPKHGRMANFILPLVTRRSNGPATSGFFGIPTLIRR